MISKNRLKYVRSLEMKKHRKADSVFVAEGRKLVGDLLDVFECTYLVATADWLSANAAWVERQRGLEIDAVTDDELRRLSFLQHPQQVLALFPIPLSTDISLTSPLDPRPLATNGTQEPSPLTSELSLALDGIQDPGNLGTIIRIADWFGIHDIYCSEDTVDAWNPKVVQATMGSIARVNIKYISLSDLIDSLPTDFPVYGTLLDGENIYTQALTPYGLIVMGNEGNGISPEIRQRVNHCLLIPSYRQDDTAESLNVAIATAITCSEFRRR